MSDSRVYIYIYVSIATTIVRDLADKVMRDLRHQRWTMADFKGTAACHLWTLAALLGDPLPTRGAPETA